MGETGAGGAAEALLICPPRLDQPVPMDESADAGPGCGAIGSLSAAYSAQLRQRFPGRPLLVAEEANGYLSYIPGAGDFVDGGHGSAAAILAPRAEGQLLAEASRLVTDVLDD